MIFPNRTFQMSSNNEILVVTGTIRAAFHHDIYEELGLESSLYWSLDTFIGFFFFYKIMQVSLASYNYPCKG